MKIIYKKGDVTEAEEKIILHGCNCQGVMGSGVAKVVKEKFPKAYERYAKLCAGLAREDRASLLGDVQSVQCGDVMILNAFTQEYFGDGRQVDYEALYQVFYEINDLAERGCFPAIAMPRIGAGLGGGNWRIIEAMIEETSTNYQPVVYDL